MTDIRQWRLVVPACLVTAVAVAFTGYAVLGAIAVAVAVALAVRGPSRAFAALAVVALVAPWDFIEPFTRDLQGLPVVLLVALPSALALSARLRSRRGFTRWYLWLVPLVIAGLIALSGTFSGVKQFAWWASASLFASWLLTRDDAEDASAGIQWTLIVAGAVLSVLALVERRYGGAVVWSLIPDYEPIAKTFGTEFGGRPSSLIGHPLRLGTVSTLAFLCSLSFAIERERGARLVGVALALVCLVGLVLSGARGAWLAAAVGLGVLAAGRAFRGQVGRVLGLAVALGLGAGLLYASGLSDLVMGRLGGSATEPASWSQRLLVLSLSKDLLGDRLWTGYGFKASLDVLLSRGAAVPTIENEYLGLLLTGGLPLLGGFVAMALFSLKAQAARIRRGGAFLPLALLASILVNVSTYNMFAWSAAPSLVLCLCALGLSLWGTENA